MKLLSDHGVGHNATVNLHERDMFSWQTWSLTGGDRATGTDQSPVGLTGKT